jgi:hypothetical protein
MEVIGRSKRARRRAPEPAKPVHPERMSFISSFQKIMEMKWPI